MIIFLYGGDAYRRDQKKKAIIQDFLTKHEEGGLDFFDLEEDKEINRLTDFLRGQSMFEPFKLAVISELFAVKDKAFQKWIQSFTNRERSILLILEDNAPKKESEYLLKKPVFFQHFPHLEGAEWQRFFSHEAKERGIAFEEKASELLRTLHAKDSWGLVTELEKLRFLGKKTVTAGDLQGLGAQSTPIFWETLNGLKSNDLGRRLFAFERTLSAREPAAKTFNILGSQWKERLPFFAHADMLIKSGKFEYEEAVLELLLQ